MTAPNKPAPNIRPYVAAAPQLTKHGRCSECDITAIVAGDGDFKVCPVCYALLWHRDHSEEEQRKKQARLQAANEAAKAKREVQNAKRVEQRRWRRETTVQAEPENRPDEDQAGESSPRDTG